MAPTAKKDDKEVDNVAVTEKRGRGRPRANGDGAVAKPKSSQPEPLTKMIDGKLMRRALGVPKKVMTGKPGRPRKEYVWVEVDKK